MTVIDELESCAIDALNDIRAIRHKQSRRNRYVGQHPAVPWLEYIASGGGGIERLDQAACYAISNLSTWRASSIFGRKSKLSGDELDAYERKDARIKDCKELFRDVCNRKVKI